MKVKKR